MTQTFKEKPKDRPTLKSDGKNDLDYETRTDLMAKWRKLNEKKEPKDRIRFEDYLKKEGY